MDHRRADVDLAEMVQLVQMLPAEDKWSVMHLRICEEKSASEKPSGESD